MHELTFEQALEKLKTIVQDLEKGDQPLEESLALFEQGIDLIKLCTRKLDEVEKKVEILIKDPEGRLQGQPFPEPVDP